LAQILHFPDKSPEKPTTLPLEIEISTWHFQRLVNAARLTRLPVSQLLDNLLEKALGSEKQ